MIAGAVSKRYAKALFELARDEGSIDATAQALVQLAEGIEGVDGDALAPGVLSADAREALGQALAAKVGAQSTLGRFLRLLADRDRLAILAQVQDWYVRMQDQAAGRSRMTVRSAAALSDSELAEVKAAFGRLAGREIVPETSVEPELIGGVLVELEGRVYDGSVKTYLENLAAKMAGV